jgi:hypothetical protein
MADETPRVILSHYRRALPRRLPTLGPVASGARGAIRLGADPGSSFAAERSRGAGG